MPPEPDFLWPHVNWIPYVDTLADAEAIELNATGTTQSGGIVGTDAHNYIRDELVNSYIRDELVNSSTITTNNLNDFGISWHNDINHYDLALEFDYDKQDNVRVASSVMKQLVEEIKKLQERNDFLETQNEKTLEQIWDKIIN